MLLDMKHTKFYKLGQLIYPLRWYIIALWVLIVLACIPFLPNIIAPFKTTGFIDEQSDSAHTQAYLNKNLGYNSENKFMILYNSHKLIATNPLYIKKIKQSLSGLKDFPIKQDIILPDSNIRQNSKDKHTAYAAVILKSLKPIGQDLLEEFKASIKTPSHMTMLVGGELIFVDEVNQQTEKDLYRVDFIATPAAIVTLLFVFGSVVAAFLPIVLGAGCAFLILTSLYFLGHAFMLSIFTLNIALLLGLCLSLDYSLFVISRFCDELKKGRDAREAMAYTQATAGKAIFFSGVAVFVSLSALLLFPINILFSVAIGGLVAVFVAVVTAIVVLPAVLAVLNTNINRWSVRSRKKNKKHRVSVWRMLAEKVVHRPIPSFVFILAVLLLLGYPFLSAKFGVSDFRIFPEHTEERLFFDTYAKKFNEPELTPILMVVKTPGASILSRKNISNVYGLADKVKRNPLVLEVDSIVTTDPRLTKSQYYSLYHLKKSRMSAEIKELLSSTTGESFTVMNIISKYSVNSPETKTLITDLSEIKNPEGMQLHLTGTPVSNHDVLKTISDILPYAILWIVVATYLILLILLRSVFLPIKAIVVNLISLSACYGALVLVFQDGYLHNLLNFEPQGMLDISLLVIIFCALFGFSMDYEVFLLTRIKESYDASHNNKKSIIFGIEKSCRIITSAAAIVIVICGSFLIADVLMVKAFGLGIAVAISVDAFLIRTILVPATMTITNRWNWYLPKWLDRILPHL
jgi:RND superfamily putative drug exporter